MRIEDKRYLDAADGWLGLGSWQEANDELNRISPDIQTHPDVLSVRWRICAKAGQWELAAEIASNLSKTTPDDPFGIIHFAYALHEMKRTKEAWDALLPMADRFPDNHTVPYNLACYACQLGDLKQAWKWLSKAIDLAGESEVKTQALEDLDLQPMWSQISEL